jgi:flagellar biogenesis protein FliO
MRPRASRRLQIEDRLSVSRGVQLAVVVDGERRFLVGISDKGVGLVSELDGVPVVLDEAAGDDAGEPSSFAVRLAEQLRRVAHGRDAA